MEISFELATEPAIKGTIAMVSCVFIAYVATHTQNGYGTSCALLIGIISVVSEPTRRLPFALLIPSKQ
jgi:hypothetical protein